MGIAAVMLTAGIFLVMAGIRDQSVPSIVADVIGGRSVKAPPPLDTAAGGDFPAGPVEQLGAGRPVVTK